MYGARDQQWVTCLCENSDSPDRPEPGPPYRPGANPECHTARKTVTRVLYTCGARPHTVAGT